VGKSQQPVLVNFPLEGEWWAAQTPGTKIPSHGTDMLGQRFAFDFVMVDWSQKGKKPFSGKSWRYYLPGVPLSEWYGWGQNVYAPCDGRIIVARDGVGERQRLHVIRDLFAVLKNSLFFDPQKHTLHRIAGNYIIMQTEDAYACFAHFQRDSVCVTEGQEVKAGEPLGRVGHSGNSTAPHLHFQLMDGADWLTAKGVPCAFRRYERFRDGKWEEVLNGVPSVKDRIRGVVTNKRGNNNG
jgi:murein DD-endopeptidase MepM/ murein hydrolase activator NlpD